MRKMTPSQIAQEAIELFLQLRDGRGFEEDQALNMSVSEIGEGAIEIEGEIPLHRAAGDMKTVLEDIARNPQLGSDGMVLDDAEALDQITDKAEAVIAKAEGRES